MKKVMVDTNSGHQEAFCEAEFTRLVAGEIMTFWVTKSKDSDGLVVTHAQSGRMVCNVDVLATALKGSLEAGEKSLNEYLAKTGELRFLNAVRKLKPS